MRLTQEDGQGNWCLKDVPWSCLRPGQVVTQEVYERIYGALWRLMEYEGTGLSPEDVEALAKKRTPMKPEVNKYYYFCPCCGARRSIRQKHQYCHGCGQALDWED